MNEREMATADPEVLQPGEAEPVFAITKVDGDPKAMAKIAQEQAQYVRAMITHALDVTEPSHWVVMGAAVYLTEAGAKRIARLFGINWHGLTIEKQDREDARGSYYRYRVKATFTLKRSGDTIEEIGTSNSRKPFFAKAGGEWLPQDEVDEDNIEKAAITNCLTRGITALVGIRGLTMDTLPERLVKGAARVDFKEGSKRGAKKHSPEEQSKAKDIGAWLIEMQNGDTEKAIKELERRTTFTIEKGKDAGKHVQGKRKLELLTPRQIEFLHKDISKEIKQFRDKLEAASGKATAEEAPKGEEKKGEPPPPASEDTGKSEEPPAE